MTETRPWRTGLAKDVPPSDTHRIDLWSGPFGVRATCSSCRWETNDDDLAALAGRAVVHAPRTHVFGPSGELLADGAKEQREARRRWDSGDATTVSEVIGERINGGDRVEEDRDDDGMSARIRRGARAGSGLSQAIGRRFAEATGEEPEEESEEDAPAAAIDTGRAKVRRARGDAGAEEPPEPEPADPSSAIRGAVRARRAATARGFAERLFGTDEAGTSGEEG